MKCFDNSLPYTVDEAFGAVASCSSGPFSPMAYSPQDASEADVPSPRSPGQASRT